MRRRRLSAFVLTLTMIGAPAVARPGAAWAAAGDSVTVAAGQTWIVARTTRLRSLTIEPGGTVLAPDGQSLTMTVDGVETGQRLTATGGTDTRLVAGAYHGRIVLTVAAAHLVPWQALIFPFRQALYVEDGGVDAVRAAVTGGKFGASAADGIGIASTGEAFDGVYVADGSYTVTRSRIALRGNGRSDFVGYGAAVVGTGSGTRLVLDGVDIDNQGSVRTGVVADDGSNVIVKNSRIRTRDGVLPADYQSTVDLTYMQQAPWMLGLVGNVRATNLLGTDTKASYLNSSIYSEGWGVLSTDTGQDTHLTAVDSTIGTGSEGYGSYAIGNATEEFLGSSFDVGTYAAINRGGSIHYGDSTPAAVAALDTSLGLGLSARELAALPVRHTTIDSARWGVMWHGAGTVAIDGGTRLDTARATFLDKGQQVGIAVDGSHGARLTPRDGVLLQMMEDDDPGPQMVDGKLLNTGVYHEPTGAPAKTPGFDVTAAHPTDATATFSHIALRGDFYNGLRQARNLVLTLDDSRLAGVVSATTTRHAIDTITSADYEQLGQVTDTAGPVLNNGVLVDLRGGSTWTVTGLSYLSRLSIGAGAAVVGKHLTMTVDGTPTRPLAGRTYTGAIVLTAS